MSRHGTNKSKSSKMWNTSWTHNTIWCISDNARILKELTLLPRLYARKIICNRQTANNFYTHSPSPSPPSTVAKCMVVEVWLGISIYPKGITTYVQGILKEDYWVGVILIYPVGARRLEKVWTGAPLRCQLDSEDVQRHSKHRHRISGVSSQPDVTQCHLQEEIGKGYTAKKLSPLSEFVWSTHIFPDFFYASKFILMWWTDIRNRQYIPIKTKTV